MALNVSLYLKASVMAARTEGSDDLPAIEARASLYWTAALPLLERLQRNQTIRAPHTRLFEYQGQVLALYSFVH
jgi:E3 SUMO-protein ligase RanBP2